MPALSRWFKQIVIVIAVLGLLTSAWPGMAQGNQPPVKTEARRAFEQRVREPKNMAQLPPDIARQLTKSTSRPKIGARQPTNDFSVWLWSTMSFARGLGSNASNFEVFTVHDDAQGNTIFTQRTNHPAYDSMPRLNRGASRLAFISDRDGNNEIYTMNLDGSQLNRLTNTSAHEYWPNWSPDSSKILFYSYRDGNAEIYAMNANGTNQTRLTNSPAWDGHPAWSPDGNQIIFSSDRTGINDLWVMNVDGTNLHQLTFGLDAYYPAWSPDGKQIAFSDDDNHDLWLDLLIMNVDGTGLTRLRNAAPGYPIDYMAPAWGPSGEHLAYCMVTWELIQGQYYWTYASIDGKDFTDNSDFSLFAYTDWWPDWQTRDVTPPVSSVNNLPTWTSTTFAVNWTSNNDAGTPSSGFKTFDIQYRDSASGVWTDWITDTTQTGAQFIGTGGHGYCFRSRARDKAFNLEAYPSGNGDTCTIIDTTPPASFVNSPRFVPTPTFTVTWRGSDNGAGITTYDIQYRDGPVGTWQDWQIGTVSTSAQFTGEYGHTYYFQSRARDSLGNLESYPGNDGDTATSIYRHSLSGVTLGNREQPIIFATIQTVPAALAAAQTRYDGGFDLYFDTSDTYTLTATRHNFGTLPPLLNVSVPLSTSLSPLYLPPLDDQISDGHFESGALAVVWNPSGDLTPTITSTVHTGSYSALLGGMVPSNTVNSGPYFSTIEQTITVPVTLTAGTLSLLYKVEAVEPLSDSLDVSINGITDSLSFKIPVTTTGWTHQWFDVSAWSEPTATVQIQLTTPDTERAVGVLVDEVTWGSSLIGSHPVYLPIMRR